MLLFALGACDAGIGESYNSGAGNSENAEDENADEGETDPEAEQQPELPKEAQYPYQVNAELAKVYLKYNITDEAIRLFDLAIQQQLKQTNTEDAELWIGLADALKNKGRKEEAALAYNKSLEILERILPNAQSNQHHNLIITRIAQVCAVLGNDEKRVGYLGRLKADENNAGEQLELAQIFQQIGNADKSEAHFNRALELTEDNEAERARVKVAYANMLFATERYDEALPMARTAMETEQASEETRKLARRLVFELYEARGEADKLDFKD